MGKKRPKQPQQSTGSRRGGGGKGGRKEKGAEDQPPGGAPGGTPSTPPPTARRGTKRGRRKAGSSTAAGTPRQGGSDQSPRGGGFHAFFQESADASVAAVSIKTGLQGSMSGEYEIGNGKQGVLEFWRGLDDGEKRELVTLEEGEVWRALRSQISTKLRFTGEVDGAAVTEVVKLFMHAMEVCEGVVLIPEDCTFETIAILLALEQRVLKHQGCVSMLWRTWTVALFLAWLCTARWPRVLAMTGVALAGLLQVAPAQAFRTLCTRWIVAFFEHEDLASKAEWKADCYMSALMLMRLVKTMEHYFVVVVLIALPFLVSSIEAHSATEHDQRILSLVRDAVGYFNKMVLLWFARFSYLALVLVLIIFFPQLGLYLFGTLLFGTAVLSDFLGGLIWAVLPQELKGFLGAIWNTQLYKSAILIFITALGIGMIYSTWDYPPLWSYPVHGAITFYLLYLLPLDLACDFCKAVFTFFVNVLTVVLGIVIMLVVFIFKTLFRGLTERRAAV